MKSKTNLIIILLILWVTLWMVHIYTDNTDQRLTALSATNTHQSARIDKQDERMLNIMNGTCKGYVECHDTEGEGAKDEWTNIK